MTHPAPSIGPEESRAAQGRRLILAGIITNVLLSVVKILGGLLGNSSALVADGLESTLDIFSSFMMWAALKVAGRPADHTHPYGHGKVESLAAVAGAIVLIVAGLALAIHSISSLEGTFTGRIESPEPPAPFTLLVLLLTIGAKETLYRLTMRKGRQIESTALQADAWHHRSDAITSLAALTGISIALIGGPAYASADDWAALFCCVIILINGARMLRGSLGEILDEQMPEEMLDAVLKMAAGVEGVTSVEKCRVRKSGFNRIADLHVRVSGSKSVTQGHDIAHSVKQRLADSGFRIADVTVHVEPEPGE
jgi:cation diffusion facilitator family transporter